MATARRRPNRHSELRAMLEGHRRELANELTSKIRNVRTQGAADGDRAGEHEGFEADPQSDIDLALIQLKADTLSRIDAALRRMADRTYGNCVECAGPISTERLRALPFAVRCTRCEATRETAMRQRRSDQRRAFMGLDADTPP